MDRSMIKGIVIGGAAMVAVAAVATTGYRTMTQPKFAEVLAVKEVTETIRTPREECQDVQVQKQAPVKDEHRVAGTVIGGVAGGVLGHQIGGGTGKTVATVAGAAAGGYAGNKVQENMQEKNTTQTVERRCRTVYDSSEAPDGYEVRYRLAGQEGTVRTDRDPGRSIPVVNGQLVLTGLNDPK